MLLTCWFADDGRRVRGRIDGFVAHYDQHQSHRARSLRPPDIDDIIPAPAVTGLAATGGQSCRFNPEADWLLIASDRLLKVAAAGSTAFHDGWGSGWLLKRGEGWQLRPTWPGRSDVPLASARP